LDFGKFSPSVIKTRWVKIPEHLIAENYELFRQTTTCLAFYLTDKLHTRTPCPTLDFPKDGHFTGMRESGHKVVSGKICQKLEKGIYKPTAKIF
jgi:hypothetical protein